MSQSIAPAEWHVVPSSLVNLLQDLGTSSVHLCDRPGGPEWRANVIEVGLALIQAAHH